MMCALRFMASVLLLGLVTSESLTSTNQECIPLLQGSDLSPEVIARKCPRHTGKSKPAYHSAFVCETGEFDPELAQALVNGAFEECKNWCVYSLIDPYKIAWFWDPKANCWSTNNDCVRVSNEQAFVIELKRKLCEAPCKTPVKASMLSVELMKNKCPGYTEDHSPQFHHAKLCDSTREDLELKHALANFAFGECRNWCVYSLETPMDQAWMWNPTKKCWRDGKQCLEQFREERGYVTDLRATLCMETTVKHLSYRKKQRVLEKSEDEVDDENEKSDEVETFPDALRLYRVFSVIVASLCALVLVLQCTVPPVEDIKPQDKPHRE